jgi:hypothetical protein
LQNIRFLLWSDRAANGGGEGSILQVVAAKMQTLFLAQEGKGHRHCRLQSVDELSELAIIVDARWRMSRRYSAKTSSDDEKDLS